MNVIVFIPIGTLLGCGFQQMTWPKVLIVGLLLSTGIEFLQFFYRKGFAELDDVIHNSIGCLLGYGIYLSVLFVKRKIFDGSIGK